jgi:hypothetical protein
MSVEALQQHRANPNHKFKGRSVWEHALECQSGTTRGCRQIAKSPHSATEREIQQTVILELLLKHGAKENPLFSDSGLIRAAFKGVPGQEGMKGSSKLKNRLLNWTERLREELT